MGFTHYAYFHGPNGLREPSGLLDLTNKRLGERRDLLHRLLANGELLAKLPAPVENVKQLRIYLSGEQR